jgi:hypothetical protein
MNRFTSIFVLTALLTVRAISQDSVSISDFRYPETKAIDWKAKVDGTFQQTDQETSPITFTVLSHYRAGHGVETVNTAQGDYNANSTFLFFHSKENHDHTFQLIGSGQFSHYRNLQSIVDTSREEDEQTSSRWGANVTANWSYLHYLTDEGFHFLGSSTAIYNVAGSKRDDIVNPPGPLPPYHEVYRSYQINFMGSLGIGYGRMRDGTFIFRALRIVERLMEDGLILRPLSRSEMLGLADRIARKREYTTNFERPDKYFVQDVVDELTHLGLMAAGAMTPYSTLRITEGFQENLETRMFGWRIYYAFNDIHTQSKFEDFYPAYSVESFGDGWAHIHEFGFEYGRPISLYTHFAGRFFIDIPVHDAQTRSTLNASATVSHQAGERLEIDGTYTFLWGQVTTPFAGYDSYTRATLHTLQGNFVYFLEDRLRSVVGITYISLSNRAYNNPKSPFTPDALSRKGLTISFGLSYNII